MKQTKRSDDHSFLQYPNEIMKTPALRKSKYYIINTGSFRHHNNCGSTHQSMTASKENKLPLSFSGFTSQKVLHESCYEPSSYDGFLGTDNDEQSLNNSASFIFGCSKRSPDFKQQYTSCKRRALIIKDEFQNSYFC